MSDTNEAPDIEAMRMDSILGNVLFETVYKLLGPNCGPTFLAAFVFIAQRLLLGNGFTEQVIMNLKNSNILIYFNLSHITKPLGERKERRPNVPVAYIHDFLEKVVETKRAWRKVKWGRTQWYVARPQDLFCLFHECFYELPDSIPKETATKH